MFHLAGVTFKKLSLICFIRPLGKAATHFIISDSRFGNPTMRWQSCKRWIIFCAQFVTTIWDPLCSLATLYCSHRPTMLWKELTNSLCILSHPPFSLNLMFQNNRILQAFVAGYTLFINQLMSEQAVLVRSLNQINLDCKWSAELRSKGNWSLNYTYAERGALSP